MPRVHLESLGGGSARLAEMMGASSVSSSSLMAMLKQKVDIKQTLGISSELAEAVQAAYQEKLGAQMVRVVGVETDRDVDRLGGR